jgi:hypothetical protein
LGNGNPITNGSVTPDTTNHTDFGNVLVSGNLMRTYTFQNTSTDSLRVDSIKMTGTDSLLFTAGSLTPPGKIAPGGSKAFSVTFTALSAGEKNATVNIYSNILSGTPCLLQQTYTYAVRGTGVSNTSILNITVIPEGLFDAGTDRMRSRDTVRAYLHNNSSPFAVVDSATAVIDSVTFTGSFVFANATSGTYYIRVNHRNSIETWSRTGGEPFVQGKTMSYNFSTGAAQAYGNNQIQVAVADNTRIITVNGRNLKDASTARFGMYGGDVNQDGTVDASDVRAVDNDAANFVGGYVITDLNGDGFVDGTDFVIADNNAANFVGVIRP